MTTMQAYDYTSTIPLPGCPDSRYAHIHAALVAAQDPGASLEVMDQARRAAARRGDRLGTGKRHLQGQALAVVAIHDAILARMLAMGWR